MQHVSWFFARQALHAYGLQQPAQAESLPLVAASGRVLAHSLLAPQPVPHYDSSAMDGYAIAGAPPWLLLEAATARPGENIHRKTVALYPGTATPVLTGSLLPAGADAILRLEHARQVEQEGATYLEPLPHFFPQAPNYPGAGADIRRAGEEIGQGQQVLPAHTRLGPRHLGALAALGFDSLPVLACPTVALAFTGNEVISAGLPGPGEVRDAFSPQFPGIVEGFGAQVISADRLPDSGQVLKDWLRGAQAQVLVLTGGSSTSAVDWVRHAIGELKARYLFESVTVRPGHPALAATLPDGRLVLGLPGNPLAAHVALYSYLPAFVAGALRLPLPPLREGRLSAPVPGYRKKDLRLVPVGLETGATGVELTPVDKTKSHMLTGFASAHALALIPEGGAEPGQICRYLPLPG